MMHEWIVCRRKKFDGSGHVVRLFGIFKLKITNINRDM